ncbi:MAG: peptide deformylase [Bacteroidota bacterium]
MPKTINDLLLLGDPLLYQICEPVLKTELAQVKNWVTGLQEAMEDIRRIYGFGRAIAAPQLGIMKRLVYMNIDRPVVFINPVILDPSQAMITLWDDCMSFPNLLVKVQRHQKIRLLYRDEHWEQQEWIMEDDLSELLQHECDHLDGVLCTMRAIDKQSFKWRSEAS